MNVFSERLKKLRNKAGLNQSELGEKLNCQRTRIADLERGKTTPNIEDLKILSAVFDVSTDYLLGITDVETLDIDIKSVCKFTGLTEEAVRAVQLINGMGQFYSESKDKKNLFKDFSDTMDSVSFFFSNPFFYSSMTNIKIAEKYLKSATTLISAILNVFEKIPNIKNILKDEFSLNEPNQIKIDNAIGQENYCFLKDIIENNIAACLDFNIAKYDNESIIDIAYRTSEMFYNRYEVMHYNIIKRFDMVIDKFLAPIENEYKKNSQLLEEYYKETE